MVIKVAIIGCGAIGLRHFQSIYNQADESVNIDIFDVDKTKLESIKSVIDKENPLVQYQFNQTIDIAKNNYHVAIVATTASYRLAALDEFLTHHNVENIILEKVVFNKKEHFLAFESSHPNLLKNTYVNCNLRSTEFYMSLKNEITDKENLVSFEVQGKSWGLGCNTIHFLDLFSFLIDDVEIESMRSHVSDIVPAKRTSYVEFLGTIEGSAKNKDFVFKCESGDFELKIKINTNKNLYKFNDTSNGLLVESSNPKFNNLNIKMPFQSQMTYQVIKSLYIKDGCNLPLYEVSRDLHVQMLDAFFNEIKSENDFCNIT